MKSPQKHITVQNIERKRQISESQSFKTFGLLHVLPVLATDQSFLLPSKKY